MDVNVVMQAIGSLGFPIVVSGALFWYMVVTQKATTEALNNNTVVMNKILEHITSTEEKGDDK